MPIDSSFDADSARLTVSGSGVIPLGEILSFMQSLDDSLEEPDPFDMLLDLTTQENVPTSETVRAIVEQLSQSGFRIRRLAIVAVGDAVYGMARMFEMLAAKLTDEAKACHSSDEAADWLDSALGRR